MVCLWVQKRDSCDPVGVSDSSRLAVYQILSIECPSSTFFWHMFCVIPLFLSFLFCLVFVVVLLLELCMCSSDIFLSSSPRTTGLATATTCITG